MGNTKTNKVIVTAKVDPAIRKAVQQIAYREDRTLSNVIERILKRSLDVRRGLKEVETA
jgi:predicted transcriptional regulator